MKDKCVSCGVETLYDKTDHVDFRLGYVEGAGQLCLDCYDGIYGVQKNEQEEDIFKLEDIPIILDNIRAQEKWEKENKNENESMV